MLYFLLGWLTFGAIGFIWGVYLWGLTSNDIKHIPKILALGPLTIVGIMELLEKKHEEKKAEDTVLIKTLKERRNK